MNNVTKVRELLNEIGYAIDHCEDIPACATTDAIRIHNAKSEEIITLVAKNGEKTCRNCIFP